MTGKKPNFRQLQNYSKADVGAAKKPLEKKKLKKYVFATAISRRIAGFHFYLIVNLTGRVIFLVVHHHI